MTGSRPILFWGFQGTRDHRASLAADQFHALQLQPQELRKGVLPELAWHSI